MNTGFLLHRLTCVTNSNLLKLVAELRHTDAAALSYAAQKRQLQTQIASARESIQLKLIKEGVPDALRRSLQQRAAERQTLLTQAERDLEQRKAAAEHESHTLSASVARRRQSRAQQQKRTQTSSESDRPQRRRRRSSRLSSTMSDGVTSADTSADWQTVEDGDANDINDESDVDDNDVDVDDKLTDARRRR